MPFEDEAKQQLENLARPALHPQVGRRDAGRAPRHTARRSAAWSPTAGAIIPAAVGVDIGCGMMAVRTTLRAEQLPDNLAAVRAAIEAAVPHGRTDNGGRNDRGAWQDAPGHAPRGVGAA